MTQIGCFARALKNSELAPAIYLLFRGQDTNIQTLFKANGMPPTYETMH
jgi:hypothetical protein